jgi:hypothetical protein
LSNSLHNSTQRRRGRHAKGLASTVGSKFNSSLASQGSIEAINSNTLGNSVLSTGTSRAPMQTRKGKHDVMASLSASLEEASQQSLSYGYPSSGLVDREGSNMSDFKSQQLQAQPQDQKELHQDHQKQTQQQSEPTATTTTKSSMSDQKEGRKSKQPQPQPQPQPQQSGQDTQLTEDSKGPKDGSSVSGGGSAESEMWQETSFLSRQIAQNTLGGMRSRKLQLYKSSDSGSTVSGAGSAANEDTKFTQMREEQRAAKEEQAARDAGQARLAKRAARLKVINEKQERMRQQGLEMSAGMGNGTGENIGGGGQLGGEGYQSRLGLQESPFMPTLRHHGHGHGHSNNRFNSNAQQQRHQQSQLSLGGGKSSILSYTDYKSELAALNSYAASRPKKQNATGDGDEADADADDRIGGLLSPADHSMGLVGGHGLAMSLGVGGQLSAMLKSQSASAMPMQAKIFQLVHIRPDETKPGGKLELAGQDSLGNRKNKSKNTTTNTSSSSSSSSPSKQQGARNRGEARNGPARWHWASGVDDGTEVEAGKGDGAGNETNDEGGGGSAAAEVGMANEEEGGTVETDKPDGAGGGGGQPGGGAENSTTRQGR